jgi:hypothetical protein
VAQICQFSDPKNPQTAHPEIPRIEIAGTAETASREPVFEVKSGPKNWFPIWTQKLVPDLDPKTGDDFGFKTLFPF